VTAAVATGDGFMNKKILIMAGAGLISFGGTFGITKMLKGPAPATATETSETEKPTEAAALTKEDKVPELKITENPGEEMARGMTEKQMQGLIFDMREKMKEYKFKEKQLTEQEERVRVAREGLQEDITRLTQLQAQLTLVYEKIRKQEASLQAKQLDISETEKANLQKLAQTYDKMDAAQAGKVLISMSANQQLPDAVKILYYMSERTSAKVLGEIASTKPEVASVLSQELKRVRDPSATSAVPGAKETKG
jgi:flagellar motility protein MotE (MotC chaperone)